jgi:hypothetical protein
MPIQEVLLRVLRMGRRRTRNTRARPNAILDLPPVTDAPSSMREFVWRPRSSDELLRKRSKWQNALCLERMKKLSNKPRDEDERVIIGSRVVFEQVLRDGDGGLT